MTYLFLFLAGMAFQYYLNVKTRRAAIPEHEDHAALARAAKAKGNATLIFVACMIIFQGLCALGFFVIGAWFIIQYLIGSTP